MKVWFSKYKLYPKTELNRLMHRPVFRLGSMIKVELKPGVVGYADCCPIEQMGDHNIHMQLDSLKTNEPLPLIERSLQLAKKDAEARAHQKRLFLKEVPLKNHYLITQVLEFDFKKINQLIQQGYDCFKIKMGKELQLETDVLLNLCEELPEPIQFRLDFNCCFKSAQQFEDYLDKYWHKVSARIDLVEDPFKYDQAQWAKIKQCYKVPLAVDFAADPLKVDISEASVESIVIKPAKQDSDKIIEKYKNTSIHFVFTHYMDYPLGQITALVEAQKHAHQLKDKVKTCGLQALDIYQDSDFSRAIKFNGPFIEAPKGVGIGFDDIIEEIEWSPVEGVERG